MATIELPYSRRIVGRFGAVWRAGRWSGEEILLLMSCGGARGGGARGNRWGRRAAVGPELARRRAPFWDHSRQFPVQRKEFPVKSNKIPGYCGNYFYQPIEISD